LCTFFWHGFFLLVLRAICADRIDVVVGIAPAANVVSAISDTHCGGKVAMRVVVEVVVEIVVEVLVELGGGIWY
jgi:hypothetical protein